MGPWAQILVIIQLTSKRMVHMCMGMVMVRSMVISAASPSASLAVLQN